MALSTTQASLLSPSPQLSLASKATFLSLPNELHVLIQSELPYPDLLALSLTSTYFHRTIAPTVIDRVSWLIDRANLNLPVPRLQRLRLKTDAEFVSGPEVRRILRNRRTCMECALYGNGRCLVVPGRRCWGVERVDQRGGATRCGLEDGDGGRGLRWWDLSARFWPRQGLGIYWPAVWLWCGVFIVLGLAAWWGGDILSGGFRNGRTMAAGLFVGMRNPGRN